MGLKNLVVLLLAAFLCTACGSSSNSGGEAASSAVKVTGVSLNAATSILMGEAQQLSAEIVPSNATNKSVTWQSLDESIATVNAAGLVTAVAAGNATIRVTTEDGGHIADCDVTVAPLPVAVSGVALNRTTATISTGATVQLAATVSPAGATNPNVTWRSLDASIATVDATGLVSAVAVGNTTIRVTTEDGGHTADCDVTVAPLPVAVSGVALNRTTATISTGAAVQLVATVSPAGATNPNVTWQSLDASIATVDSTGLVTGVSTGNTTIRVTTEDGGYTDTVSVYVSLGVLVVAHDWTAADAMENALTALAMPFTRVDIAGFQGKSIDDLRAYSAVFYTGSSSGNAWATVLSYLDDGGNLFIADNDLGYSNHATGFYQNYLQSTYLTDAGADGVLTGMDMMTGVNPDITLDPFPDDFSVRAEGVQIFQAPTGHAAGVAVERNGYKAVYLSWDFDDIADPDDEETIIDIILSFFEI